jgi:hypothetical protein
MDFGLLLKLYLLYIEIHPNDAEAQIDVSDKSGQSTTACRPEEQGSPP